MSRKENGIMSVSAIIIGKEERGEGAHIMITISSSRT